LAQDHDAARRPEAALMRVVVGMLVLIVALIALGGPPYLLIVLAYMTLEGAAAVAATIVLAACWVAAPWGLLVAAWHQARSGASRRRIALLLAIAIVLAAVGQGIVERLPMRAM